METPDGPQDSDALFHASIDSAVIETSENASAKTETDRVDTSTDSPLPTTTQQTPSEAEDHESDNRDDTSLQNAEDRGESVPEGEPLLEDCQDGAQKVTPPAKRRQRSQTTQNSESSSYFTDDSNASLAVRVKKAPTRVRQYKQYIELMEDRVSSLEAQVRELLARDKSAGQPPQSPSRVSTRECSSRGRVRESSRSPLSGPGRRPRSPSRGDIPMIPKFNPMEWRQFRGSMDQSLRDPRNTCAIDILVGEPIITFTPAAAERRTVHAGHGSSKDNSTSLASATYDGPLPERIRINSVSLIRLLEKCHDENISDAEDRPILAFRPYRGLLYYESKLREWLEKLEDRWRPYIGESAPEGHAQKSREDENNTEDQELFQATDGETVGDRRPPDRSRPSSPPHAPYDTNFPRYCQGIQALYDLRLLMRFIDNNIKPHINSFSTTDAHKIAFQDLWYLFNPGDEVVSSRHDQAYRVIQVIGSPHTPSYTDANGQSFYVRPSYIGITCVHMDSNGKVCGPVVETFEIEKYRGEKEITSLRIYPLRCDTDPGSVFAKLVERGKKFMDVGQARHMYCKGVTINSQEEVDGQVIIDFEQTISHNKKWKPNIDDLEKMDSDDFPSVPDEGNCGLYSCCGGEIVFNDAFVSRGMRKEFLEKNSILASYTRQRTITGEESNMRDEELILLTNRVFGFILRSRKWATFNINDIREVKRNSEIDGFDQLVLPRGHKKMLSSLVRHHFRNRKADSDEEEQVDLVRGKGKGLIILLHGAPGVGKTSTAECIAESFDKPLFPITCGDLGVTPTDVEERLETNFTLAHRWDCILLLDEADIFLSERTKEDFTRNSLVSVFLRVLEYYAGILFLTTNRVGAFDEAFRSRIHLGLYYPPLDMKSTIKVWKVGIAQTEKRKRNIVVKKKDILKYAEEHFQKNQDIRWNGRQIRNAFQIAIALAEFEMRQDSNEGKGKESSSLPPPAPPSKPVTLRRRHFEKVAQASIDFDTYLKDVFGVTAREKAHQMSLRFDDHGLAAPSNPFGPPSSHVVYRHHENPPVPEPPKPAKPAKPSKDKKPKKKKKKKEEASSSSESEEKNDTNDSEATSDTDPGSGTDED